MKPFIIAPSILSADFACLGKEVEAVLAAGADWIHIDVMDNHFVDNLTFGALVCQALRNYGIKAPFDVHLMVSPVDNLIRSFAKAGATSITIHPEACEDLSASLQLIKTLGCLRGLAINPETSLNILPETADQLDMILLMSVNPGFAGQKFISETVNKIRETRQFLDKHHYNHIRLEVDGGINLDNIASLAEAGADTFVAGSAIFKSKDYQTTLTEFRHNLDRV